MGNRAVIANGKNKKSIGIYLHWNGGPASVTAFVRAAKDLGMRDPTTDSYGMARLCQIIGNFFGGSLSLGIDTLDNLDCDNGDNGVYYLKPGWTLARESGHAVTVPKDQLDRHEGIYQECMEKNSRFIKESA